MTFVPAGSCAGLAAPLPGEVIRGFAPVGRYGGHWGIDISADTGSPFHAADVGRVTFAGRVAGMLTVTVAHGDGLRTSYSYLTGIDVSVGQRVGRETILGRTGVDHDLPALHFSVRVGDR